MVFIMGLFVVSAASISTIICDVVDKVNLVLDCVKDKTHSVKTIVLMETPSAELVSRGQQAGIHIFSLQEMEVSRRLFLSFVIPSFFHQFFAFYYVQLFCVILQFLIRKLPVLLFAQHCFAQHFCLLPLSLVILL